MRSMGYQLWRTWRSIAGRPSGVLLTLGSVALALVLVGGVFLLAQNLDRVTRGWGSGARIAVDLQPEVPPADAARVEQALRETEGVRKVSRVEPEQAKARLMRQLGSDADVVAAVEPRFLPLSFEVTLGGDRGKVVAAQKRIAHMAGVVPGVEAVRTVETWFHQMDRLVAALRLAGLFLALLVILACVYVVMITIRLQLGARRSELQVLRLVGATERFVRTPFLLEGVVYGAAGFGLALALLYGVYHVLVVRIGSALGQGFGAASFGFLPARHAVMGLGLGMVCGLLGAALATRRRDADV